jgi:hypothetical protein
MKQEISLKDRKKHRKQINGKFNSVGSTDEVKYKKYHCSNLFLIQKLKSWSLHPALASLGDISCVVSISPTSLNPGAKYSCS